jgi:hypothetical protein
MFIDKVAAKLHVKSKTGRSVLKSSFFGFAAFGVLFIASIGLKIAPVSTALGASAVIAVFTATLYFIKNFAD